MKGLDAITLHVVERSREFDHLLVPWCGELPGQEVEQSPLPDSNSYHAALPPLCRPNHLKRLHCELKHHPSDLRTWEHSPEYRRPSRSPESAVPQRVVEPLRLLADGSESNQ
ncbi:hypothetical protein L596_009910 [Steinernema carpocapsae]|uniref:Uncharacterized protein n=1 Tax=Steinernema carpocapsae TaxID=34508 RepID=A0A4U5PH85_STECR|nr:hypothetical protein L596_009910 [Steinernema carpocapsae]